MKLMRLAAVVAAFAMVGGTVVAEDMDVRALQAKLAAQEARLNDLQAKMYSASCEEEGVVAEGLTSLRKNAVVTLGGTINTRYHYRSSKLETNLGGGANAPRQTVAEKRFSELSLDDAILEVKIDVNDHFDAYMKLNFLNDNRGDTHLAQNAWIRWKNICNSGFGVLVGRAPQVHGGIGGPSVYDNWQITEQDSASGAATSFTPATLSFLNDDGYGEGMFVGQSGVMPIHSVWGRSRTTQITPYWESQDGKFKAEVSFMQGPEYHKSGTARYFDNEGVLQERSKDWGLGSMSARVTWKPIEGLKLLASVQNLYGNQRDGLWLSPTGALGYGGWTGDFTANTGIRTTNNNTSVNAAFEYTPCFFNRMTVWASYMHGWNEGWIKNQDSDSIAFGLNFKVTDQLMVFGEADFLRVKNDQGNTWHKARGYMIDTGIQYVLPYGVNMQVGYRHEDMRYKNRAGQEHTKFTADSIYGHLGFNF